MHTPTIPPTIPLASTQPRFRRTGANARPWPFAPRPQETQNAAPLHNEAEDQPENDFLILNPAPILTEPRDAARFPDERAAGEPLHATEPQTQGSYWFDR